jgi:serine/threonine protein kinase
MDWGLARVLGQKDRHDRRPAEPSTTTSELRARPPTSARRHRDSPLFTMDGDVVGTPAYMPPEQARGEVERCRRARRLRLGAILYQLLARRMPFVPRECDWSSRTVLLRLLGARRHRCRLCAPIVPPSSWPSFERAMARAPEERYGSTREARRRPGTRSSSTACARVQTGARAELAKWDRAQSAGWRRPSRRPCWP